MTNATSTICSSASESPVSRSPQGDGVARLRLARSSDTDASPTPAHGRFQVTLRNPDLVADLRQARAARFASRYEWLAIRRRRAQIAARHELGE
jgi:hypothetical protein